MKKLLLFLSFLFINVSIFSQHIVKLHNGTEIKGQVVENEPTFIKFIYDGETLTNTLGKTAIAQIQFASGRIEECSQKVVINDPKLDYENIMVFRDKEDCVGLVRIKEISAKSGGEFAISDKEGRYIKKTIVKLQKEAAKLGGCAILITSQTGNSASLFKNPHSAMTAVVYKY